MVGWAPTHTHTHTPPHPPTHRPPPTPIQNADPCSTPSPPPPLRSLCPTRRLSPLTMTDVRCFNLRPACGPPTPPRTHHPRRPIHRQMPPPPSCHPLAPPLPPHPPSMHSLCSTRRLSRVTMTSGPACQRAAGAACRMQHGWQAHGRHWLKVGSGKAGRRGGGRGGWEPPTQTFARAVRCVRFIACWNGVAMRDCVLRWSLFGSLAGEAAFNHNVHLLRLQGSATMQAHFLPIHASSPIQLKHPRPSSSAYPCNTHVHPPLNTQ